MFDHFDVYYLGWSCLVLHEGTVERGPRQLVRLMILERSRFEFINVNKLTFLQLNSVDECSCGASSGLNEVSNIPSIHRKEHKTAEFQSLNEEIKTHVSIRS
jgi:hypothetical protein